MIPEPKTYTELIARHPAVLHWWCLQRDCIVHHDGHDAFAPRKGTHPAVVHWAAQPDRRNAQFATIAGRDFPCNPTQSRDGIYAEATLPRLRTGTWTIVAILHDMVAGSDPWGLHLDAQSPNLIEVVSRTTSGQTSLRSYAPDPALREDVDLGPGVALNTTTPLVSVVDLHTGAFQIATDFSGTHVSGIAPGMAHLASLSASGEQSRLVMGRAFAQQPFGGIFAEYLLIKDNLFNNAALLSDLNSYFNAVWKDKAP